MGSEANIHRTNDAFFKSCQASNRTNVYSCRIKGKVVLFYDFVVRSIFACNIPIFKLITLLYEPLTIANRQDVLNRIVFITLRNLLNDITLPICEVVLVLGVYSISIIADLRTSKSLIKGLNDFLYTQYGGEVLTSFAELGTSYSGLSGKSAQDFGSGKPFITYLNVYSNNVIKENDFQYVAIKDDENQNVVKYGDVLFTLSSETPEEVGVGSVYLGKEKVYLNSFCFGIHITNTEVAFPPYLSYYVSLTAFRKFIYPYAQGSTRFNLCKADFEKACIKLPTLENQKRIYSVLEHIDCKIETERQMLNLYNSQKQYLLRQMFI